MMQQLNLKTIAVANHTTIALAYLLVVLFVAATSELWLALLASVVSLLCVNFFFLPPVGTLTIADPQNLVSFLAFMATAVIASQLSGRARQRTLRFEASLLAG